MKIKLPIYIFACLLLYCTGSEKLTAQKTQTVETLQVPGIHEYCNIDKNGVSVLPSGRYAKPAGEFIYITSQPYGMALSPDGKKAATIQNGILTLINLEAMTSIRIPSYKQNAKISDNDTEKHSFEDGKIVNIKSPFSKGSFLGVAFGSDSKTLYLSGGDHGDIVIYNTEKFEKEDSISLDGTFNGTKFEDSFTSDLEYNADKHELLVLDRGNFRMVRIDLKTKKITASIPVGRQPFGLKITPDRNTAFVANVGMYSYPLITGATPENADSIMISHHPYGDNTKESIYGTVVEGRTIPGVGSPLSPDAMSVFTIDLNTNKVLDKFKTGAQIGEMVGEAKVVGGASPNSIAVGSKYAYVTNGSNDNVSIIDYKMRKIVGHINITTDARIDKYRGYIPFGICMTKDEKTLYVALLGYNAVAVIDIPSRKTIGMIPTGWGASRVLLSKDEKELYVCTIRGLGAGPNGGAHFVEPDRGTYVGDIQQGTFQKIELPNKEQLANYTKEALDNTFRVVNVKDDGTNPLPPLPKLRKSPIKHIVYITKENRSYDEIFGQLTAGGARGDSTLARYGVGLNYVDKLDVKYNHINVASNHIKAAKQFAFSDNFYCDSDASIHGHHWLAGVIPNEWVESNAKTDKTAKLFSTAPGRRFPGTLGSIDPEDYAEIGGMWEALERAGVSFYNFGQANETAHVREHWNDTNTGAAHLVMVPMQDALFTRTSHNYAGYNTNIPDQFRINQFEYEFNKKWINGTEELPSLLTVMIPNDHSADLRPEDGYGMPQSFIVDNDLAVGRILEFLSHTKYWKDMLVIITEDDPQGGKDHIDAHRSVLMLQGPYVKKGYVSHTHANFGSIMKTMYNILNVPYVNQYDATASLLDDFFTDKPDFTPYIHVPHDKRLFDLEKAMAKYKDNPDWRKIMPSAPMDDEDDARASFDKD